MPRKSKNKLSWMARLNQRGGGSHKSSNSWQRAFDYLPDLDDGLDSYLTQFGSQNFNDSDDDDGPALSLYGVVRGEIVGLRYYKGTVNDKELVLLVREPHNQYDPNAVKVNNVIGQQVGHIKKELARALAVIMDNKLAKVDGIVPFGTANVYTMPIDLTFWGQPENKARTIQTLKQNGFMILEGLTEFPRGASRYLSSSQSLSGENSGFTPGKRMFMNPKEMKSELDKLFETLGEADKTSECDACSAIVTPLFGHQKKALQWMIQAENSDALPPFWVDKGPSLFFNSITNFTAKKRPSSIRGGILADDMGLGKTLEIIALILTNFEKGQPLAVPVAGVLRPSKIAKMERLKIYRATSKEQPCVKAADKPTKEDVEYVPPASVIIRKPLLPLSLPDNGKSDPKLSEKTFVSEDVNLPHLKKIVVVRNAPFVPGFKIDSECNTKTVEPTPVDSVSVPPAAEVMGRPKRNVRKPVQYRDMDEGEEEEESDKPAKKRKMTKAGDANWESQEVVEPSRRGRAKKKAVVTTQDAVVTTTSASVAIATTSVPAVVVEEVVSDANWVEECRSLTVPLPGVSVPCPSSSSQDSSKYGEIDSGDELPDLDLVDLPDPASSGLGKQKYGKSTGRTKGRGPRATLIICPLSTLSNWLDQIEEHVDERVLLQVFTYYGASRTADHEMLADQDIVLTTYQTMASDAKASGPLQKVHWLRIVLDEGHTIRNPAAQMTKAILSLRANRKWVVTGTPIQNALKDLWSLVRFLNVEPFQEKVWWDRTIARPLSYGDENAVKRVQSLLGMIALRRVKTQIVDGKPLIDLPTRDVFVETVTLSAEEREIYDTMQNEGKLIVSKYCRQGTLLHHYGEVMALMMRLRQMCLHPFLIAKAAEAAQKMMETQSCDSMTSDEFRKKLIEKIVLVLNSGSDEECAICLDQLKTPVITHCAHVFCRPCIEAVINTEKPTAKCPMCRGQLSHDTLVEVPPDYGKQEADITTDQPWHASSKVDSLMNALVQLRLQDATIKSLVVSQFTSFLTILETPLRENGFKFVRLDGTMSSKRRVAAIESFMDLSPGSPTIFLLSLKAGGVGLNLTAASRVFLLDPAWNPASEDQCFDRCHRLGQTRPVVITKFIVENSIEERMIEMQDKKRKLVQGVFGEENKQTAEEKRQTRINDIRNLMDL